MKDTDILKYINGFDWKDSKLGLERTVELLERLGNPHKSMRYIHVAGTNGKGSVCAMLSSILSEAGYVTGLYTSPYINEFNERIQVDNIPIDDRALTEITLAVKTEADKMKEHPTTFELVTAIAFVYFAAMDCDITIMEVGLGGRLDATNVIPVPEVSVIMPISYDHTAILGDTLEKIAAEKAGIIKGGIVVSARQEPEVTTVLKKACKACEAELTVVGNEGISIIRQNLSEQVFSCNGYNLLSITLLGDYQLLNAAIAVTVIENLKDIGWSISEIALRRGLRNTEWPARFEIFNVASLIETEPEAKPVFLIIDGGHNIQCVDVLISNINKYFYNKKITFIIGVMKDKDYRGMAKKIIPLANNIYTVKPNVSRALSSESLKACLVGMGVSRITSCKTVEEGLQLALKNAKPDEVICAFGTLYMAGELRSALSEMGKKVKSGEKI